MKLYIAEPDAQFLLNMDACDLRADARALAELREKLFILWGDLEEQKTQQRAIVRSGRQALAERDGNVSSSPARERGDREKEGEGRENGGGGIALDGSSEGKGDRVVPRGKSFTCCIKEFGVKVRLRGQDMGNRGCSDSGEEVEEGEEQGSAERERGWKWERRFRMFGTTIL